MTIQNRTRATENKTKTSAQTKRRTDEGVIKIKLHQHCKTRMCNLKLGFSSFEGAVIAAWRRGTWILWQDGAAEVESEEYIYRGVL